MKAARLAINGRESEGLTWTIHCLIIVGLMRGEIAPPMDSATPQLSPPPLKLSKPVN